MKQLQAASIGSELLVRRAGTPARQKIEFDPVSGELRLRPRDEVSVSAATPVDQIASDGFA